MENERTVEKMCILMRGTETKRMHTRPIISEYTVGKHSCGVAFFCMLLMGDSVNVQVLKAALLHDIAEQFTGDVPHTFKQAHIEASYLLRGAEKAFEEHFDFDAVTDLTLVERDILKAADILELMYFCVKERSLGNLGLRDVMLNCLRILGELHTPPAKMKLLSGYLFQLFQQAKPITEDFLGESYGYVLHKPEVS